MNTVETRKQDNIATCITMIRQGVSRDYLTGAFDTLYKSDLVSSDIHLELNALLKAREERKCST